MPGHTSYVNLGYAQYSTAGRSSTLTSLASMNADDKFKVGAS